MIPKFTINNYLKGLAVFFTNMLFVLKWQFYIFLFPILPLIFFLPDQLEGKGEGSLPVRLILLLVLLIWVPMASVKFGKIRDSNT